MRTEPSKLKAIQTIFRFRKIEKEDQKKIVQENTGGRTTSTRELTDSEARQILAQLKSLDGASTREDQEKAKADKMKRNIIRMAHEMGWKIKGSSKIDMKRLNDWCTKSGYLHKPLDNHIYSELPKLVTQFQIVHKGFLNKL